MNFEAGKTSIARNLGSASSVMVIAEVAQGHDGSLGMAHAYIDAIASACANAVKFQTHLAAAESTPGEPWRVKFNGIVKMTANPIDKAAMAAEMAPLRRLFTRRNASIIAGAVYSCLFLPPSLPTPIRPIKSLDRSLESHVRHQWPSPVYGTGYPLPCVAF